MKKMITVLTLFLSVILIAQAQGKYKNFTVSVYSRSYETARMGDDKWLQPI